MDVGLKNKMCQEKYRRVRVRCGRPRRRAANTAEALLYPTILTLSYEALCK